MKKPLEILDGRISIFVGDCIAELAEMEPDSVDSVVTSPPYWGLRNYNVDGQLGLEPTLGAHLDVMVAVFEAVKRVLKPTGTLWINYGDCYATQPNGRSAAQYKAAGNDDRTFRDKPFSTVGGVLKNKDLCMVPNRLAIALQDAGWWVRSEIIWGKSNPMPDSSGAYRPSTAHEKIFMLTKCDDGPVWRARDTGELSFNPDLSERCPLVTKPDVMANRWTRIGSHYDAEVVKQGLSGNTHDRGTTRSPPIDGAGVGHRDWTQSMTRDDEIQGRRRKQKMPDGWDTGPGGHGSFHRKGREKGKTAKTRGRTPRHENHVQNEFLDEVERGQGRYLRNYEPAPLAVWPIATKPYSEAHFATFPPELAERCILAGCPKGGLVLDPFGGAGTTALVAARHGRRAHMIELNPEYADIARKRIESEWKVPRRDDRSPEGPLFQAQRQ